MKYVFCSFEQVYYTTKLFFCQYLFANFFNPFRRLTSKFMQRKGELPPLHHVIKMCNTISAKIALDLRNDFARVAVGKYQVAGIAEETTQADHAVHAVIDSAQAQAADSQLTLKTVPST